MTKKLPLVTYGGKQVDPNLHYTELLDLPYFNDLPYNYKAESARIMFKKVQILKKQMNEEFFAVSKDREVDEEYHAMVLFEAVLIHAAGIYKDILEKGIND